MRAALALLFACSAPAKPPAIANATATAFPPPEVMDGLTTRGLPAVAADGAHVVLALRAPDDTRGLPNLTLAIKDRSDVETEHHVVVSLAEADQLVGDADGNHPALTARIARANAWLRDHHAAAGFEPLVVLDPEPTQRPRDRTKAMRERITVSWSSSRLHITDGTTTLVDIKTPASWLPPERAPNCTIAAYLDGAAIDRARRLAVITIAYTADADLCLEPSDQHHVVAW